jgi:hypothetical protein
MKKINERQALRVLREGLKAFDSEKPSRDQAVEMLQLCGVLAASGSHPRDVDYELIAKLLEAVWQPPVDWEAPSEIHTEIKNQEPVETIRLARGLDIFLDESKGLVAMALRPRKFMEGLRLMRIVGIGHDTATDVAERHDDYLVDAYLNSGKHGVS